MLAATARIFADHFQFYVYDASYDHYKDPRLDWATPKRLAHGYLATERAIYVSTVAALNSHRLRVYIDEAPAVDCERSFRHTLQIESGTLAVSAPANAPEDDLQIPLAPGRYALTLCARAVGVDELQLYPDRAAPLEDEELLRHDGLEHYDLYIEHAALEPA